VKSSPGLKILPNSEIDGSALLIALQVLRTAILLAK